MSVPTHRLVLFPRLAIVLALALVTVALPSSASAANVEFNLDSPGNGRIVSGDWSDPKGWGVGDVNGDGLNDVASAPNDMDDNAGLHIIFSSASPTTDDIDTLGTRGFKVGDSRPSDVAALGDVNGDGLDDFALSFAGESNNLVTQSGSVYVIYGKVDNAAVELAALGSQGFRFDGQQSAPDGRGLGFSLAPAGDLNFDGRPDLYASAPGVGDGQGAVYGLYSQNPGDVVDLSLGLTGVGFRIENETEFAYEDGAGALLGWNMRLGSEIENVGDQDADGRQDVAALIVDCRLGGAFGCITRQRVHVLTAQDPGTTVDRTDAGVTTATLDNDTNSDEGPTGSDTGGYRLLHLANVGDQNSDGRADLAVGSPAADTRDRVDNGAVFVAYLPASGTVNLADVAATSGGWQLDGPSDDTYTGEHLASAEDQSGDGRQELLAMNLYSTGPGNANGYMTFSQEAGTTLDASGLGFDGYHFTGGGGGGTGTNIGSLGDLDGDALPEIFLSGPRFNNAWTVTIVYSAPPPDATTEPATDVTEDSATLNGTVDPNFSPTGKEVELTTYFEYGATASYGDTSEEESVTSAGGPEFDVAEPLAGLVPGETYHYRVVAYNNRGQVDFGQDRVFTAADEPTADTTPPVTTITSGPSSTTTDTSATFTWTVNEPASSQCQLDNGPIESCFSGKTYGELSPGTHVFRVRSIDLAGNGEFPPKTYTWTVEPAQEEQDPDDGGGDSGDGNNGGDGGTDTNDGDGGTDTNDGGDNSTDTNEGTEEQRLLHLDCGRRNISLIDARLIKGGRRVLLEGVVAQKYVSAKQHVRLYERGRQLTKVRPSATGFWRATVKAPPKSKRARARYSAKVGRERSTARQLSTAVESRSIRTVAGGRQVEMKGRILPGVKPKRVQLVTIRRVLCGRYSVVARVRAKANGTWKAVFDAPEAVAGLYRAEVKVLASPSERSQAAGKQRLRVRYARAVGVDLHNQKSG